MDASSSSFPTVSCSIIDCPKSSPSARPTGRNITSHWHKQEASQWVAESRVPVRRRMTANFNATVNILPEPLMFRLVLDYFGDSWREKQPGSSSGSQGRPLSVVTISVPALLLEKVIFLSLVLEAGCIPEAGCRKLLESLPRRPNDISSSCCPLGRRFRAGDRLKFWQRGGEREGVLPVPQHLRTVERQSTDVWLFLWYFMSCHL